MIKSIQLTIAGQRVTDPISSIMIKQQTYGHELLRLTVKRVAGTHVGVLWDAVYLRWDDTDGTYYEFWGYFHSDDYAGASGGRVQTQTIYALGTTMPMKSVNPRSFGKGTASYAMREVISSYSLGAQVDTTKSVLSAVIQGQESDWKFITRLGMQAGLLVYARGPRVIGVDPLRVIADPRYYSRAFNLELGAGAVNSMVSFRVVEDQTGADGTRQVGRTSLGVDAQSGNLIKISASAATQLYATSQGEAVTSLADAQRLVTADVRLTANWVSAVAELQSYPSLVASSTVSLGGTGIGATYSGLWLVAEATHNISWDLNSTSWQGTTDVVLGRDRPYSMSYLINQNMVRPKPPTAGLVGNRWVNQGTTQ